ncbi:MAG: ParB N-terminal domain-containing protein [Anaerolineae bacterium]|nr:ParB N-terminal domain-containing protein [Anaerolineae bacterium]
MSNSIVNQMISVEGIKPHPYNYNQHSQEHVADLRASLRKFGQVRSIVVQEDTAGGYLCVAGHGVLQAARLEGLAEIKADLIPGDWPQVKVLAYLAADNELARHSDPDLEQLAQLTHTIKQADDDLARLAAGSDAALKRLTTLYDEAEQHRAAEERADHAAQFLNIGDAADEAEADGATEDYFPPPHHDPDHGADAEDNPYVNLLFVADRVQRDFVLQTLAHVRDVYHLETSLEALVKVCELFEESDGAQEAAS